jgi:hypothetical protein
LRLIAKARKLQPIGRGAHMHHMHLHHEQPDAFRLLVSPYHPDVLRFPRSADTAANDRLRHTMTWNVFKTLEQIAPTVWMRPLVARCAGLPDRYDSAPQTVAVACWADLQPAPAAMLRRGRRRAIHAAAVVETDDTVITFLTPSPDELVHRVLSETAEDGLLDIAEATAHLAGTRAAYVSVVLPIEVDADVWTARVGQRTERVRRLLAASDRNPENVRGMGVTTWEALGELLIEAAASRFIPRSEQHCALAAAQWMGERLAPRRDHRRQA